MRAPDDPAELLPFLAALPEGARCSLRVPLDVTEERFTAELARRVPLRRLRVTDVSLEWTRSLAELPVLPEGPARPTPEGLARLVMALQPHYARAHPAPPDDLAAALRPALRADRVRVHGEDGLVAWAREGAEGFVLFVGVRPQARGQGVGRALQLSALHGLRGEGALLARGACRAANGPMNRLFEGLGYREEALLYELIAAGAADEVVAGGAAE